MRIRALGRLEVLTDAGDSLNLGTTKQRTVCAMLLANANRLVTVEQLIDELWPDDPPRSALANARTYAANLRRLFRTFAVPFLRLESRGTGYVLHIEAADFDLLVFQDLVQKGREAVNRGDPIAAEEHLDRAIGLWRGQPFEDVTAGPVLAAQRTLLAEEYVAAVEDRADVLLDLGRHRTAIPLLRQHVHANPTRERGWELLIAALHHGGDVAGALAAYSAARTALVEQLGVEPGARLRARQRAALQGEPDDPTPPPAHTAASNDPATRPSSHPARETAPVPRSLPRPIRDFTGREDLAKQLIARLRADDPGLVAIDGMAGAGKTTLAVHVATKVADRYPDGQLYLDLHGHSESAPVAPATALSLLLGQLGLSPAQLPAGLEERAARWRTEVAHRRLLILLDNAADSHQVEPLLPGASPSAVLITSRRRLAGLHDVRHVSLGLLRSHEAIDLLTRIVGQDTVTVDPEAGDVARLCGYLPLALRLAGARLASRPAWTMGDLARRLHTAEPPIVELSVEGSTVAAAFTLSYRNLPPATQRMFRLVGQHPGADLDEYSAAALCDLPVATARDLLEELVDVHLIEQPLAGRYRLHDLIREYARRVTEAAGVPEDVDAALTRLVDYYLHTFVNASTWLMRGMAIEDMEWGQSRHARKFADHDSALPWLTAEWRNALAVAWLAIHHGWHRHACLLHLAMWPFTFRRGHADQMASLQERIAESVADLGDRSLVGMTHHYLGGSYARLMRYHKSVYHLEHALDVWREMDDRRNEASTLAGYLVALSYFGKFRETTAQGLHAVELAETSGRTSALAMAHKAVGTTYRMRGEYDAALRHLRRAAVIYRSMGNISTYNDCLSELGLVHCRLGHATVAEALLRRAEKLKRAAGNPFGAAEACSERGMIYLRTGRPDEALACQRQALADGPNGDDPQIESLLHNNLSETLCVTGDVRAALEHGRIALRIAEKAHYPYEQARAHARIAAALVDDPVTAAAHWEKALAMHTEMGTPERHEAAEQLRKLRATPQPCPQTATGAAEPRP